MKVYAAFTEYQDMILGTLSDTPEGTQKLIETTTHRKWDDAVANGVCLAEINYIEGFRAKEVSS